MFANRCVTDPVVATLVHSSGSVVATVSAEDRYGTIWSRAYESSDSETSSDNEVSSSDDDSEDISGEDDSTSDEENEEAGERHFPRPSPEDRLLKRGDAMSKIWSIK